MTMHLLPSYFTTTANRKQKRKKQTSKSLKSLTKHELWVLSMTKNSRVDRKAINKSFMQEYSASMKVDRSDYVSSGMSGSASSCIKRGVMANLHRETQEVQDAILEKASRVMPLYNKGALQLLSPNDDLTKVGTLSRRG